jgi:hypothetical protein
MIRPSGEQTARELTQALLPAVASAVTKAFWPERARSQGLQPQPSDPWINAAACPVSAPGSVFAGQDPPDV